MHELPKHDTLHESRKTSASNEDFYKRIDLAEELTSHFKRKVSLDTLLDKITHQEKVKILAELTEKYDDEQKCYFYFDSLYNYKLKVVHHPNSSVYETNTIFFDGKNKISFKDYRITCYKENEFECEDYGFNCANTLRNPKVIEVCGKRFLYSDVSYWCNGIGCGCNITFIYDLETHKPTFVENYGIPYSGFFVSDFDNDNKPDLLVISQTEERDMKGFELEEFEIKLVAYRYDIGKFKMDNQYLRPYCYELYSITEDYNHSEHAYRTYAIIKDDWFKL